MAAPTVLLQSLPNEESVLLDTQSEGYFGLDGMGTQMWHALIDHRTVGEAEAALLAAYDVPPAQLRADLERFLEELVRRGLVSIDGA